MPQVEMISHGRHNYGGKALVPNQPFTVDSEQDADELKILGLASRAGTYQTKPMVAAEPGDAPAPRRRGRPPRQLITK